MVKVFGPEYYDDLRRFGESNSNSSRQTAQKMGAVLASLIEVQPGSQLTMEDMLGYYSMQFVSNQKIGREVITDAALDNKGMPTEISEVIPSVLVGKNVPTSSLILGRIVSAGAQKQDVDEQMSAVFDVMYHKKASEIGYYPAPSNSLFYLGRMTINCASAPGNIIRVHTDSAFLQTPDVGYEVLVGTYEEGVSTYGRTFRVNQLPRRSVTVEA